MMLNSLATFFKPTTQNEVLDQHKKANAIIYRDELSKTKPITKTKPKKKGNPDSLDYSEPLINKEEAEGVLRVKVTMTKREAKRLLSRCKEGGVLEFRDVARVLVDLPMSRVVVLNLPSPSISGGTMLRAIPEEF